MVMQTPKQSRKLSKRHTLEPQIFLQLELLSPGGKHLDPSKVGVLNDDWKASKFGQGENNEEFVTHIRLQHCTDLRKGETEIRLEGPDNHISEWPDFDSAPETEQRTTPQAKKTGRAKDEFVSDNTGSLTSPSAVSYISEWPDFDSASKMEQLTTTHLRKDARANDDLTANKNIHPSPKAAEFQQPPHLGRHDYLLEPLPNELFDTNSIVKTRIPSPHHERSEGSGHDRSQSRRQRGLKKTLSAGSIDVKKVDDTLLLPVTTRRRRRKSVGADVQASRNAESTSAHSRRRSGHSRRSESLGVDSTRVRPTIRRVHTNPASHRRPDKIGHTRDAVEASHKTTSPPKRPTTRDAAEASHKTTSPPKRPSSRHRRSSGSKDIRTDRVTNGCKPRPSGMSHHQHKETLPSELLGSAP